MSNTLLEIADPSYTVRLTLSEVVIGGAAGAEAPAKIGPFTTMRGLKRRLSPGSN